MNQGFLNTVSLSRGQFSPSGTESRVNTGLSAGFMSFCLDWIFVLFCFVFIYKMENKISLYHYIKYHLKIFTSLLFKLRKR